jgi:hypothetical protein
MDTDFDFNVASDSDWTLIEPSLPAPPLARPNHSHVPRIASGYKLSTDGTPSSGNYSKVVGHGHSLNHARPTGFALERPAYSSKSSGWEPPSSSHRAKPLAKPPVVRRNASSLELPRELPVRDSEHLPQFDSATPGFGTLPNTAKRLLPAHPKPAVQQLSRSRKTSSCSIVASLIPKFLQVYSIYSDIMSELAGSEFCHEHFMRILDGFSPSTIFRYMSALLAFAVCVHDMQISLHDMSAVVLADCLLALIHERGHCSMALKAIRWGWKHLQLTCFKECFSPIITSFTKVQVIADRKEALPLPLLVLIQWEMRILQSGCSVADVLTLGTYLFMAFSGMRFGDIQRVMMHKLQYDDFSVRGLSWKTKTCSSGVPFGTLCSGFLSRGSHTWIYKFLLTLDTVFSGHDPSQIDFMLPSIQGNDVRMPLSAMSYAEALFHFRTALRLPWRSTPLEFANVTHYTIHGLKSTFLSWASQLQISPELRRLQGHHKDPLQSTRLYSRDDVDGSLRVQVEIVKRIQAGWRPHTPLGRGGQIPLVEPQFKLESFSKSKQSQDWKFFSFDAAQQFVIEPQQGLFSEDSSSSTDSDSDSSSSQDSKAQESEPKKVKRPVSLQFDEAEFGSYRKTLHIVMDWDVANASSETPVVATACGRRFAASLFHRHNDMSLAAEHSMCTHHGCRKRWQAIGALD